MAPFHSLEIKIIWCKNEKIWQVGYDLAGEFKVEVEFENFFDAYNYKKERIK